MRHVGLRWVALLEKRVQLETPGDRLLRRFPYNPAIVLIGRGISQQVLILVSGVYRSPLWPV